MTDTRIVTEKRRDIKVTWLCKYGRGCISTTKQGQHDDIIEAQACRDLNMIGKDRRAVR